MNREDELQGIIDFETKEIEELKILLNAAKQALRSYQHGNNSTELAKEIADKIEKNLELNNGHKIQRTNTR